MFWLSWFLVILDAGCRVLQRTPLDFTSPLSDPVTYLFTYLSSTGSSVESDMDDHTADIYDPVLEFGTLGDLASYN
ncbi:hypothetical protein STEG23_028367 [Scotinomys teguina]